MSRRGIRWCKLDLDMLRDPKVQLVIDEAGAEGVAVWIAAIIEMYTAINDGQVFIGVDSLTRRVACDLNLGKIRAKKLLKTCEKAGLFDHEMWAEGRAANERVAEFYEQYLRKCDRAEKARAARDVSNIKPDIKP